MYYVVLLLLSLRKHIRLLNTNNADKIEDESGTPSIGLKGAKLHIFNELKETGTRTSSTNKICSGPTNRHTLIAQMIWNIISSEDIRLSLSLVQSNRKG